MNLNKTIFLFCWLFFISVRVISAENLVISEFMAINSHGIQDEDKEYSDWIEIENTGTTSISLKGLYLTDNPQNLTKWKFPDVKLDAGKFLIVFASEKNRSDPAKTLHTNFKLSGSGEFLALVSTDGKTLVNAYTPQFPVQEEDISYGIYNGQFVYFDQPTPGAVNSQTSKVQLPVFSRTRGYCNSPFEVTLSTPDSDTQIYYTTNGIRPTPQKGTLYAGPIRIETTTPLSAVAVKNGVVSSVISHTYFFTDSILKQDNHPDGYPAEWGAFETIPGIAPADYEMDPDICNDPAYKASLVNAFQDLPSVSIVTDPGNLFSHSTDPETGGIYIYTCSTGKGIGEGWERPASVEYFDPKANEWFQVNCALQLHGGASRVPEKTPKHSFRLEFKTDYGPSKLDYPLFSDPEATTTRFNSLVLRANFGYTWLHWSPTERKAPKYVQDSWAKDMQQAMGHHSAHNKFVHLFLNGIYWGMYNISERLDENFMGTYLKGKSDDFDVIKDYAEVVSGNLTAWNSMMALANSGLSTQAAYQKIQGNNPDGTRNETYEPYLNVDNLIDYMLLNFYAGNNDWDHHNWVAARNKVEPGKGFRFFSWDAEHLFTNGTIDVTREDNANCPSHLFTKLKENADFRMRVADRVQQLFFGDGLLTPQSAADSYMKRAKEIEQAILCESARWGDYRRDVNPRDNDNDLYTPEKYWVKTLNWLMQSYFPPRTALVVNQLRMSGLYPHVDAPEFSDNGGSVTSEFNLEISAKTGTIYYTVDGTDPRSSGGKTASNNVYIYSSPLKINGNGTVKARVKDGVNWSALTEATFVFPDSTLLLTAGFGAKAGNGNFPNPFRNETFIYFNLEKASQVKISVYNTQGKLVDIPFEGKLAVGTQYQKWIPQPIEKGIYLYQIQTDEKIISGKMMLMK